MIFNRDAIVATLPSNGWNERCIAQLPLADNMSFVSGLLHLVDAEGRPTPTFGNNTWGVTIEDCYRYCDVDAVPYSFNFNTFGAAFSNFLLPWLALTAQLPYETGSPWDNILSLCLAVGSPALVTYSLTLTILNRYSLRARWHSLHVTALSRSVHDKYNAFSARIKAVQYLLQEAQQVPLRASQERGWLSSLIVSPQNQNWWRNLQRRLRRTRRGVTFSLVAQILAAGVAWLFTIASSFIESRGDRVVANQLSSGSLWLWLIPVIWGWITVGTQNSADSIEEALNADTAYRTREPPLDFDDEFTEEAEQRAIVVRSGLAVQPHRVQTNEGAFDVPPIVNLEVPRWLGADIMGDEKREGPIFNYARAFTWWQFAQTIESALKTTVNNIAMGKTCKPSSQLEKPIIRAWNTECRPEDNLAGDSYTTAHYCGLDLNRGQILAYPEWSDISSAVWQRIFVAGFMALFVLWGTTGPGLLIAYYTPTKGIGCRSASYIIYGGLATLVWLLLAVSVFFSHAAMLRYQRHHRQAPSIDFRRPSSTSPTIREYSEETFERTGLHSFYCACAVGTRYLGKTVAVLNTIWIVLTSLLEYTGVYDRCYCRGDQTGLGLGRGWLVLFKTESDLANYATTPWAGGVAMSIIICSGSFFFFWLGSRKSEKEAE